MAELSLSWQILRCRLIVIFLTVLALLQGFPAGLVGIGLTLVMAPFFAAAYFYWRSRAPDRSPLNSFREEVPWYLFGFLTSQTGAIAYRLWG